MPDYSPCNFLMADAQEACYLSNRPGVAPRILVPGIYGMSNASLDTPWPKLLSMKAAMRRWFITGASLSEIESLFEALANTNQPPDDMLPDTGLGLERERELAPVFIRGPTYGTRCSSILWVTEEGQGSIIERRFGPGGSPLGQTQMHFRWPIEFRHS